MIPDGVVDALAGTWPGAVLLASVQGGVVLLVVWGLCRVWRTMPPRVACWLWRIGYLKLLLGLVWTAPIRLPLLPPEADRGTPVVRAVAPAADDLIAPPRLAVSERPVEPPGVRPEVVLGPIGFIGWFGGLVLLAIIGWAWLGGVVVMGARLLAQGVVAVGLRRRARPVDDPDINALCAELAGRVGLRRSPPVLVHDRVAGPLLLGLVRPAIVLPVPVPDASSAPLRHVLAHELAHLRRRDVGWNVMAAVTDALFFFHPLVWLARREHRLAEESACDEVAVAVTGAAPAEYAGTLLAVAAGGVVGVAAFSAGVVGSRKTLERRIRIMFRPSNWSSRRRMVVAAMVVLSAVTLLPPWRVVAQEKAADKPGAAKPADGAKDGHGTEAAPPPAGDAGPVQRYMARLVAETLQLHAAADGVVERLPARSGERVKKAAVIAELDGRRARAALEAAEAKLELAKSQYDRIQSLVGQQNLGSRAELDEKRAQMQVAKAEMEMRRQDLEETRILAPFDGVLELTVQAGQRVSRGDALGRLIAVDAPRVSFQVPESEVRGMKVGRAVEINVPAFPDRLIKGEISEVSPTVDPQTGTVAVVARVTDKADGLLPGMTAGVTLRPAK